MDLIKQYHELCEIKPEYHKLHKPYNKNSMKKAIYNLEELELHYNKEYKAYYPPKSTKGGSESKKINVMFVDF